MRKEKCALQEDRIEEILEQGEYGILALCAGKKPYAVPMNYVYKNKSLYFHGAKVGLRYDYIQFNDQASFCVIDHAIDRPDLFSTDYASVIVNGTVELVKEEEEIKEGLFALIEHLAPQRIEDGKAYIDRAWENTAVFKLNIQEWSGKERKRGCNE